MHYAAVFRITFWVLVIFGLGFWTGRFAGSGMRDLPPLQVQQPVDDAQVEGELAAEEEPSRRELIRATNRVIASYQSTLKLTPEQIITLKPLFVSAGQAMAQLPKGSPLRLGELERFHQALDAHLTAEQKKLSKEILLKYQQDRSPAS